MSRGFHKARLVLSALVLLCFSFFKVFGGWPSMTTFALILVATVLSIIDATSRLGRVTK